MDLKQPPFAAAAAAMKDFAVLTPTHAIVSSCVRVPVCVFNARACFLAGQHRLHEDAQDSQHNASLPLVPLCEKT